MKKIIAIAALAASLCACSTPRLGAAEQHEGGEDAPFVGINLDGGVDFAEVAHAGSAYEAMVGEWKAASHCAVSPEEWAADLGRADWPAEGTPDMKTVSESETEPFEGETERNTAGQFCIRGCDSNNNRCWRCCDWIDIVIFGVEHTILGCDRPAESCNTSMCSADTGINDWWACWYQPTLPGCPCSSGC